MSALTDTQAVLATRPEGWLLVELQAALGIQHAATAKRLSKMMQAGLAGSARVPGRRTVGRYFATQAQADAWAQQQPAHVRAARPPRPRTAQSGPATPRTRHDGTLRATVLQAIQAAGSAGVIVSLLRDELGLGKQQMVNVMATLTADDVRCEWHKNRRLAWAAGVQPSRSELQALQRLADADVLRAASKSGRTRWGHSIEPQATYVVPRRALAAPVTIGPARLMGEADTSRAVITICPAPAFTARYQYRAEAPDERWPSFSSIPLGATLSATHLQEAA